MPGDKQASLQLLERAESRMTDLTAKLTAGEIELGDWQISARQYLREGHALQLIAGANGSKEDINPDDWLKLGNILKGQYRYLETFAHEIADGDLSDAQIQARANLYALSGRSTFWKQATNYADLPTYPGEQQCLGNCGCSWIDNGDGSWTWERGKDDSCDDCIRNEAIYNPFVAEDNTTEE